MWPCPPQGDYFGEMALLTDKPRSADVKATSDCMLLSLGKSDLELVLHTFPAARMRIEHAMAERERDLRQKTGVPPAKTSEGGLQEEGGE